MALPGYRLEQYTLKRPQDVLLVVVDRGTDEPDQVMVFRGFSSSLVRQTEYNPDLPVIAADDKILSIDRIASPYNPVSPRFIQQGLTWQEMEDLLRDVGV